MKRLPILIDTNLLVLLVVGAVSRELIGRHKKLSNFVPQDYDTLIQLVSRATSIVVTPNTLSETSNLISYISEPARSDVLQMLRKIVISSVEVYVPSTTSAARQEFIRLGITDSAILHAVTEDITLLTTDLDLYLAAQANGSQAINFNQIRDQYL